MPVGQLQAIKTDLLCSYLNNPPNPPCTNLIPDGAVYSDVYTLNLIVGASYTITFGVNEMGLFNGAQEILNPHTSTPVTFIASGDGIFIIPSTNFSTVTAIVCGPPCVNLIPDGAMYDETNNYATTLTPGVAYQITFGVNDGVIYVPGGIPIYSYAPGTFQFTTGPEGYAYLTGNNNNTRVTAIICAVPASLIFTSVSPNTASGFSQLYDGVITGTGFALSGINLMKLDDGVGHAFNFTTMTISNDTTINIELMGAQITPVGVFTIYYSKNAGATWTTTGLTITSS
jgi:hypothetical protein